MPFDISKVTALRWLKDKIPFEYRKFLVLYASALLFVIAISTSRWYDCGSTVRSGIWSICLYHQSSWQCQSFDTDLAVTVQAFSMICILGYLCTGIYPVLMTKCLTSASKSFSLILSLCLLCLSIASLQMMILVIYSIKVKDSMVTILKDSKAKHNCSVSWSFGLAVISVAMTTITAILAFSELNKITHDEQDSDSESVETIESKETHKNTTDESQAKPSTSSVHFKEPNREKQEIQNEVII